MKLLYLVSPLNKSIDNAGIAQCFRYFPFSACLSFDLWPVHSLCVLVFPSPLASAKVQSCVGRIFDHRAKEF